MRPPFADWYFYVSVACLAIFALAVFGCSPGPDCHPESKYSFEWRCDWGKAERGKP